MVNARLKLRRIPENAKHFRAFNGKLTQENGRLWAEKVSCCFRLFKNCQRNLRCRTPGAEDPGFPEVPGGQELQLFVVQDPAAQCPDQAAGEDIQETRREKGIGIGG